MPAQTPAAPAAPTAPAQVPPAGLTITQEQVASFHADGFVTVNQIIDPRRAEQVAERYVDLFAGRFETGLLPDEWNWKPGRDPEDRTRQICNAWKSDRLIASVVLDPSIGRACAQLGGWEGTRLSQDNVLWKPPGAKALGYHQDSSYELWADPPDWVSCWIALDDTTAEGGTVEYVRGSHQWPHSGMIEQFHAPDNYRKELDEAARPPASTIWRSSRSWSRAVAGCSTLAGPGTAPASTTVPGRAGPWWRTACRRGRDFTPRSPAQSTAATSASATCRWTRASFLSPGTKAGAVRSSSRPTCPVRAVSRWC